jgi:hypothetical protein
MPDNINVVVVDDIGGLLVCNAIQIGDGSEEDEAVEEDVNVNDSKPPVAGSQQDRGQVGRQEAKDKIVFS